MHGGKQEGWKKDVDKEYNMLIWSFEEKTEDCSWSIGNPVPLEKLREVLHGGLKASWKTRKREKRRDQTEREKSRRKVKERVKTKKKTNQVEGNDLGAHIISTAHGWRKTDKMIGIRRHRLWVHTNTSYWNQLLIAYKDTQTGHPRTENLTTPESARINKNQIGTNMDSKNDL